MRLIRSWMDFSTTTVLWRQKQVDRNKCWFGFSHTKKCIKKTGGKKCTKTSMFNGLVRIYLQLPLSVTCGLTTGGLMAGAGELVRSRNTAPTKRKTLCACARVGVRFELRCHVCSHRLKASMCICHSAPITRSHGRAVTAAITD